MTIVGNGRAAAKTGRRAPRRAPRGRGWRFHLLTGAAVAALAGAGALGYYYVTFSRMIDARLHGAMQRTDPRIFARPFLLHRGEGLTERQAIDRLNDLGYAQRPGAAQPGEFAIGRAAIALVPRAGDHAGELVRLSFAGRGREPGRLAGIERVADHRALEQLALDAPLITALVTQGREKRRDVPLASIPPRMVQAVLSIEDRRFYEHPGIDPIRIVGAAVANLFGRRRYLEGGSTLTQQIVKNTFLTPEKTMRRKVLESFMAMILDRKLTKNQILELYLNDVSLGQRGSFAIHGVAEAERLLFGKDISNVSLVEAATIAGLIQSPSRLSPFTNPERAKDRRNVVLHAMADAGYLSPGAADRASHEPLQIVARALDAEAPYFVDYVGQAIEDQTKAAGAVDVYTTLDLHLQRLAQEAVRDGLAHVDSLLPRRRRGRPQAALMAVDPRTGDILAMVGGRSYNRSQYNRAINARRQPGSVFKPFVYLAAFERARAEGRTDFTPATIVDDEPTSFDANGQTWTPNNYDNEYDGPITLRRALALSRNVAAVKVAESAGYEQVAALWSRIGAGTPPRAYPSIALGVFEASPFQIATAYTIFPNGGIRRPLRAISRIVERGHDVPLDEPAPRRIAGPDTTFLVTNMLRSVLDEGTGAAARAAGFSLDAAGKSGTTNDLRDAWFVGFTPEILTVVWVGMDDNQALGLSGSTAALPIWTQFMMRALAGQPSVAFPVPEGIVYADIDRDTGLLATSACPRVFREAFLAGTVPTQSCPLHSF
ncbi:MAG TPA: PBP1A family penicillin-binding protein [Vicinamibacterales bacterium]|nr:PBP1A family penicillin-binding protein [Vicinamibacterales bacterium]